jgi:biopolymer transport protein ExbD
MAPLSPRRYRRLPPPAIIVAPIVDIVFILLIFMMLVSRFLQPAVEVQLPGSTTAEARELSNVVITVDRGGQLMYQDKAVSDGELAAALRKVNPAEVDAVRLRADERVNVKRLVEVLDIIRGSPLRTVALEVKLK